MIKVLKIKQGNPHFDPRKQNDGGGYDQPIVTFEKDRIIGTYHNSSCGDFGSRHRLEWNDKVEIWGTMEPDFNYHDDFNEDEFDEIIMVIEKALKGGYHSES